MTVERSAGAHRLLRVLHVTPTYLPATRYGGPIFAVHGLCRALARRGHKVEVATTSVDGSENTFAEDGAYGELDDVGIHYFNASRSRRLYWAPKMRRFLGERIGDFDIVHIHAVFLWPTWIAARTAARVGVPYVLAPRGMLVNDLIRGKSRLKKLLSIALFDRPALGGAAAVHFTSERERTDCLEMGLNPGRSVVIPNGLDLDEVSHGIHPGDHGNPHRGYVLYLGRINWKKGLDRLVEAMRLVDDVELVIAGNDEEGYRERLEAIARDVGIAERIRYVGPVHGCDKWKWLAGAEVVVLPSRSENFGNVVLEAMSVGVPVVLTLDVGLAEAVKKAGAGLVSDPAPEALAASIRQILDQPERAQAMGAAGRQLVEAEFTWARVAEQMEQTYLDILERRRPVERATKSNTGIMTNA